MLTAAFLENQRRILRDKLRRYTALQNASAQNGLDPKWVRQKLTVALPHVRLALERLGCGTYGICECCRADIPVARLTVVPGATRCASCQEAEA